MLTEVTTDTSEGPNCSKGHDVCTGTGQWLVRVDDKLYSFTPNSQLQKDIWLNEIEYPIGASTKEGRLEQLRWFCHKCGTHQEP